MAEANSLLHMGSVRFAPWARWTCQLYSSTATAPEMLQHHSHTFSSLLIEMILSCNISKMDIEGRLKKSPTPVTLDSIGILTCTHTSCMKPLHRC